MIDREHVFGLRNEVGRDVRDITRNRGPGACNTLEREGAMDSLGGGSERNEKGKGEKDGEKRKTEGVAGGSKKVEAKMRRRAPPLPSPTPV